MFDVLRHPLAGDNRVGFDRLEAESGEQVGTEELHQYSRKARDLPSGAAEAARPERYGITGASYGENSFIRAPNIKAGYRFNGCFC